MIPVVRTMLAVLLLATLIGACSSPIAAAPDGVASIESPGASPDASARPSASLDPEAAQLVFAECMRDHGIDIPDPGSAEGPGGGFRVGGPGKEAEELQAAMEACGHFLEDAGMVRRELDPEQLDRMVEFAQCMREHGIDMPDPQTDGGLVIVGGQRDEKADGEGPQTRAEIFGVDPRSEEFQAAEEACRPILGDEAEGPALRAGPQPAKP